MSRTSLVLAVLAALAVACDDGTPGSSTTDGAPPGDGGSTASDGTSDPGPAETLNGIWTGTTSQNLPVSLVIGDGQHIRDFALRVDIETDSGRRCPVTFQAQTSPVLSAGAARVLIHSDRVSNSQRAVDLVFGAGDMASGTVPRLTGRLDVACPDSTSLLLSNSLLEALTFVVRRTSPGFHPTSNHQLVATAAPLMIPAGCSHQPASPWSFCAFVKQQATGQYELWVVDTKRPLSPTCGQTSSAESGCLRLTSTLLRRRLPAQLATFVGDTLIFTSEGDSVPSVPQAHSAFAWRPEWPMARHLVDAPRSCEADPFGDAVACIAEFVPTPTTPAEGVLFAGRLGGTAQPLQRVSKALFTIAATAPVRFALSPGGEYLVWSGPDMDAAGARAVLSAAPMNDLSATRQLAADVSSWRLSPDGRRLIWLRRPDGTLETADLKAGTAPVAVSPPSTRDFVIPDVDSAGQLPVVALGSTRELSYSPDVTVASPTWRTLERDVLSLRSVHWGTRRVVYSKMSNPSSFNVFDLHLANLELGASPCTVLGGPVWSSLSFAPTGTHLVSWRQTGDGRLEELDLGLIDSATCAVLAMRPRVRNWQALSDGRFLVASDGLPLLDWGIVDLELLDPAKPTDRPAVARGISGAWQTQVLPAGGVQVWFSVFSGWPGDGLFRVMAP